MARARNIKPGFFANELLAEISPVGRLLFAGLWTIADRSGRLEDRPGRIKAAVLPYDKCNAERILDELAERGFIVRYVVDGKKVIQVVNWSKHQNPHVKEQASTLPAPPEPGACTVQTPCSPEISTEVAQNLPVLIPGFLDSLIPSTPIPPPGGGVSPGGDDALEEEPRKRRKPPRTGAIAAYHRAWAARYGSEPLPEAGDCKSANRALSPFDEPQRILIVEAYVADEDPWLCERAHRLGFLPGQLDRIRAKLNGTLSSGTPRTSGNARSPITPPSFRAEDEPAGSSKLDGIPIEVLS